MAGVEEHVKWRRDGAGQPVEGSGQLAQLGQVGRGDGRLDQVVVGGEWAADRRCRSYDNVEVVPARSSAEAEQARRS
ncbi:MAG: hypothetical protein WKF51_11595 [Geodermatophilaceae bacterium]